MESSSSVLAQLLSAAVLMRHSMAIIATQMFKLQLTLLLFSLSLRIALTQRRSPYGCSSIFRYQQQSDHWIGILTPPEDGLKSVKWLVRFASHGIDQNGTVSSLDPYPDKQTALQTMHNGGRAECFVRFDGYVQLVPKVEYVELNGQVLCTGSGYAAPYSSMTRELHMALTSQTTHEHRSTGLVNAPITPNPWTTTTTARLATSVGSNGGRWDANPFLKPLKNNRTEPVVTVDARRDPAEEECGLEGYVALQNGGEIVPRGRFPWLAALYLDTNSDPNKIELIYKCVTSLISARTVITAAHCIYGYTPAQLRVYVGRHDTSLHPEKDATLMTVESMRTHPDFVGNVVPDCDVGLLVLAEKVQFSYYVRPICLWSKGISLDENETTVAGWGNDANFKPTRFPVAVNVSLVSREKCLFDLLTARDFLTPRTLCAGNSQGHGPCLGDSGGGLMVLHNDRWYVRGIVSLAQRAGHGCNLSRFVIYSDVASHLSWVERNIVR
ncbi:CLIP domain-containing serine protease B15 [Drosophila novamexicana]|uniref:CLIP domain-containing serine protease B15 n=1 Tax=Drosophila novamexicana TaxID=47314 RepID=UPI0011E5B404|nr:CLIP domain-containing serine protease B15 [Drosophila novamexicana]